MQINDYTIKIVKLGNNDDTPKPPAGTFRCNSRHGCLTCPYINHGKTSYTFTNTGETIKHHITCDSTNLTYMIQCKRCKNNIWVKLNAHFVNALKNTDRQQTINSTQTPQQQSLPTLINLATRS